MKRILSIFLLVILLFTLCLSACGKDTSGNSSAITIDFGSRPAEPERSESTASSEISEVSKPESDLPEGAVELLFTRFTEHRPTFVMVGKCAENAEVTATIGDESVTVDSYGGYFSVYFSKIGGVHQVTFTQTVNGEPFDQPRTYTAAPTSSKMEGEQKVIASNEKFQFFLSKMIPDFVGGNLYDQNTMLSMTARIKDKVDLVKSYNPDAEIIYMVIPSPMTIYPELVPDFYTQTTGETRLDQVLKGIENSGATVIDVRDTFMKHKNDEMPLYYKLDSHWADYGAYLAYVELFDHISEKFPDAAPRDEDEFIWEEGFYKSCDAILYLDYPQKDVEEYAYYRQFGFEVPETINSVPRYRFPPVYPIPQLIYSEESTAEKTFYTNRENLPSCTVFRDSYSASIFDLIPERMDATHYMGMWNYAFDGKAILFEQPDYVIYLIAEWNMDEIVYR